MSDYLNTLEDNIIYTSVKVKLLVRDALNDFFAEIKALKDENEYLKNRNKELEELLNIAKERD